MQTDRHSIGVKRKRTVKFVRTSLRKYHRTGDFLINMAYVHMVMLLSCALNVFALPMEHQRQTSTNNPGPKLQPPQRPNMTDNGAERRLRETANNHFNTTLPRRLNKGDKINISGTISGAIKIHLLTEDKEVEGRLESDFDKKTITLTSHNYIDELDASEYGAFEKEFRIQLNLSVSEDNLIEIHGWDGTYLGLFSFKHHHSKLMYMHILGDIRDVALNYQFK